MPENEKEGEDSSSAANGLPPGMEDLFSQFGDIFSELFDNRSVDSTTIELPVTGEMAANGVTVDVLLPTESCGTCSGSPCLACKNMPETQNGFFVLRSSCGECVEGTYFPADCAECGGDGFRMEEASIEVPSGIGDGQVLRIAGLGKSNGETRGDLFATIVIREVELPGARVHHKKRSARGFGGVRGLVLVALIIGLGALLFA